jgi:ribosomal-protein-alanine N-acetyltransferase
MPPYPTLQTARLILRPFQLSDAADVQRLAGAPEVASTTLNIPHPYKDGMAEEWIARHQEQFDNGQMVHFAVTLKPQGTLTGAVGLEINARHERAEMGYWIGVPYWGNGYCTEAARAVLRYGFEVLKLHRIFASHFPRNPPSGRVMEKIGMKQEGLLRGHVKKQDRFEDYVVYGLLREDSAFQAG